MLTISVGLYMRVLIAFVVDVVVCGGAAAAAVF
jgi:hypothetical protein